MTIEISAWGEGSLSSSAQKSSTGRVKNPGESRDAPVEAGPRRAGRTCGPGKPKRGIALLKTALSRSIRANPILFWRFIWISPQGFAISGENNKTAPAQRILLREVVSSISHFAADLD